MGRGNLSKISTEWEQTFSRELGGISVTINEAKAGQAPHTILRKSRNGYDQHVEIFLSPEFESEMGQLSQLRHEHGHIEKDSFGLKHQSLSKLSVDTINLIEDARINLGEAERYVGFREGYQEIKQQIDAAQKGMPANPVLSFLYNTTQCEPKNDTEKRIFAMARRINAIEGAHRGEERSDEFYGEYSKFAAEVVRYVGTPPDRKKDGEGDGDGEGSGEISDGEAAAANQAAQNAQQQVGRFFAKHEDVDGAGGDSDGQAHANQHGIGSLMNPKLLQPRVDDDIKELVKQKLRKLKMVGKKNKDQGIRMNMRVASRAMFTGETKMFGAPARKDIRNAKFVIVQDISGSMDCNDIRVFGKQKRRIEVAYHFGMGMKEFLEGEGAKVEEYHYDDSPFVAGLTMETGGGTQWGSKNMAMLKEWVQGGKQVIIMTDGWIGFEQPEVVRELFKNPDRRPVGMQLGQGGSDLEQLCPDWKDFTVTNDPNPALDAMVKAFARRFKF